MEKLNQEQNETNSLIEQGMTFKVGRSTFHIKEPYLGTLDMLSALYLKMEIDERLTKEDGDIDQISEVNRITVNAAKVMAEVVAVSVLNGKWRIRLLSRYLSKYFYWKLKPSELIKIVQIIKVIGNPLDFLRSIRLTSGMKRMTEPNPIEQSN